MQLDELDSRGTFQRAEVSKELKKMRREELEGKLGITYTKVGIQNEKKCLNMN